MLKIKQTSLTMLTIMVLYPSSSPLTAYKDVLEFQLKTENYCQTFFFY